MRSSDFDAYIYYSCPQTSEIGLTDCVQEDISYTVEKKRNDELIFICESVSSPPANTEWTLQL